MEFIILGLLIYKNMTIYEINSAFKDSLSLIYSASYGSIQNAIKKLLKNEMITFTESVENGRNKKTYSLCPSGKEAFINWMQEEIKENKLETNMLIKVYFLGFIESDEDKLSILEDILEKTSAATKKIKTLECSINDSLSDSEKEFAKYSLMTLDYGVIAHEAGLNWVHKVYNEVKKGLLQSD